MNKGVKSTFAKVMTMQSTEVTSGYQAIIGMGMVWNKLPAQGEWLEFAERLLSYVLKRHPTATAIHIINDIYDDNIHANNVKQHEQQRRVEAHSFAPNIYPSAEQKMPWQLVLHGAHFVGVLKHRLQHFILQHWKRCMLSVDMFYTVNKDCYNFQTEQLDVNVNFTIHMACKADTRAF